MPQPTLEFYYDISCPFAYIASTRIAPLAARTNTLLTYRPVLLGAIYRLTAAPQGAAGSASDVFNPAKKAVASASFQRTLRRLGVEYHEPPKHPVKTTKALRLLYYVGEGWRGRLSEGLFRAYWVEGRDVSDSRTLVEVVREVGVGGEGEVERVVRAIEDGSFEGERERGLLEEATKDAVERGAPGVPGFWVPDEVWRDGVDGEVKRGRLYWGQDRMSFVEAVLSALGKGINGDQLSKIDRPLQGLTPRVHYRAGLPQGMKTKVELWYDFSSPWAFLGWSQLARLQRRFGSGLEIDFKPFLLGILFKEIGAPNVPSLAISKQKSQYMRRDHTDWVRWWNAVNEQEGRPDKPIEFKWASKFPIRTPNLLRAVLVEPALIDVLYRACWERDLDMSSDQVLTDVINEAGYPAIDILKRANEQQIKDVLRARTKQAKDIGLNGVPSYRVFRKQGNGDWQQHGGIVWGQDEIFVVEDLIAGWNESDNTRAVLDTSATREARL